MVKRGFVVGTREVSFEEGLEEAIEMLRMKQEAQKNVSRVAGGC